MPAMKILKKVQNKISEFNERCEIQKEGALHFLDIQSIMDVDLYQAREIDFFFYSKKKKNAFNLKSTLEQKGYSVEEIYHNKENEFSICGTARINSLDETEFLNWVEKMNEYAFIYNCLFDGWGMIGRLES